MHKLVHIGTLLAIAACGRTAMYGGRSEETIHPRIPGTRFSIIAVIAGQDSRSDLNMSAGVREMLVDSGFTALPAAGRWETENEATVDLCSRATYQGVAVVVYDRITLRACPNREIAFEIQGTDLGLRGMAQRLMAYLRSGPAEPPASPPMRTGG